MKQPLLIVCFVLLTFTGSSQIKALTSNGDEVLLYQDGTWKYVSADIKKESGIDTSQVIYSRSANATFLVKSNKVTCGVYIDPKKWRFSKSKPEESSEYEFELNGKDAYGMIITEQTEIPLETLGEIALDNAKSVAPDIEIIKQEYRKVNGNTVLMIQMQGAIKGIKVTYFGYYFSYPEGSVQLLTYAATNLFKGYKGELEQLLNGFIQLKE